MTGTNPHGDSGEERRTDSGALGEEIEFSWSWWFRALRACLDAVSPLGGNATLALVGLAAFGSLEAPFWVLWNRTGPVTALAYGLLWAAAAGVVIFSSWTALLSRHDPATARRVWGWWREFFAVLPGELTKASPFGPKVTLTLYGVAYTAIIGTPAWAVTQAAGLWTGLAAGWLWTCILLAVILVGTSAVLRIQGS